MFWCGFLGFIVGFCGANLQQIISETRELGLKSLLLENQQNQVGIKLVKHPNSITYWQTTSPYKQLGGPVQSHNLLGNPLNVLRFVLVF